MSKTDNLDVKKAPEELSRQDLDIINGGASRFHQTSSMMFRRLVFNRLAFAIIILAGLSSCKPGEWDGSDAWYESTKELNADFPDVFYLVSTNILHEEGSLRAINTPEEKAVLAREMAHMEKKVFKDSLNFFAPYYHQYTMDAMLASHEHFDSLVTAITDEVYAAFHHYMKHSNGGRPVILAGFSQGALLAKELLKRMTPREYDRVVASYILGWGLSEKDLENRHIHPATGAYDTGVCISFNTVSSPTSIWPAVMNDAATSINPVNWVTDSTPAAFEYKGQDLSVSLDTDNMCLTVSGFEEPQLAFTPVWPSGCLHFYEIQFYNSYLNRNALDRCRTLHDNQTGN